MLHTYLSHTLVYSLHPVLGAYLKGNNKVLADGVISPQ